MNYNDLNDQQVQELINKLKYPKMNFLLMKSILQSRLYLVK